MNTQSASEGAAIFELRPLPKFTSQGDLLAYVARTRRQLDRFEALPRNGGPTIDAADASRIRMMCDELEADIINGLSRR